MSNPNENCLEGMSCPKCLSFGPFHIEIQTVVLHGDEGILDMPNDKFWDDTSFCACPEPCGYQATVLAFHEEEFSADSD